MSFNWLTRSTWVASTAFPWKISKSANALLMFPTTSGWLLPETTLRFLTCTGKSRSSLVTSARFNVITTALSTTLPALSRVTYMPCLCFPLLVSLFLFGMTVPEPNQFRQHDPFPHLRNCTPKLPLRPASWTPLAFHGVALPLVVFSPSTAAYTFRFVYRTVFAVFCVCCFVLARIPCFLRVSSRETIHTNLSLGGHSYIVDVPFRIMTCRFLLAIESRTWV